MDFVAIDFETANHNRSSACQIGLAKVKDNRIVDTKSFFVKPIPDYYEPINMRIHGIDDTKTKKSPTFEAVWKSEISSYIKGFQLVAHNAPFEKSVFNALSKLFDIDVPVIYDTLALSRHCFPGLLSYSLDFVCESLDISMENHHNAESDAIGCAKILITISEREGEDDITQLFDRRISHSYSARRNSAASATLFSEAKEFCADENSIKGKTFSITGALSFIRRDVAAQVIENAGGIFKNSLSRKVDYLIVGDLSFVGGNSEKMTKVQELRKKGVPIEVLTESQFAEMVTYEGKKITEQMIEKDSREFLESNRYNILVGKNVCISEGFADDMLLRISHRGACTGVTFWKDEASNTDFYFISNMVLNDIRNGMKSPSVIRMEDAMNNQANPEGNPDNHHVKFIDEPTLMQWLMNVEAYLHGKMAMRLSPNSEPQYVKGH